MRSMAQDYSAPLCSVNSAVQFHRLSELLCNQGMDTAADNRAEWLRLLVAKHGTYAALNRALGRNERDATLNQIAHASPDSKSGRPRQMGDKLARAIEQRLRLPRGCMDRQPESAPTGGVIINLADRRPVTADAETQGIDILCVPMLDVRASAGSGDIRPDDDPIVGSMRINTAWARRHLGAITGIQNLVTLIAHGRSMEPTFGDGSILLVDHGVAEIQVDGVYVLCYANQLYVKRVTRRLPDGALIVSSDNAFHSGFTIAGAERESVEVLGRVAWAFDSKGV